MDDKPSSPGAQGATPGNSGSVGGTKPPDGAPESDVMALKRSLEDAQIALANTKKNLDTERAARQAADEKLKSLEPLQQRVGQLEQEVTAKDTQLKEAQTSMLNARRLALQKQYNLPEELVKNYTQEQLEALEKALPSAVKTIPGATGFDSQGSPGSGVKTLTAREMIRQGLQ